jgi:hypothetical protein
MQKWCFMPSISFILIYLGKAIKIGEVGRKSSGSSQEVARKSFLYCRSTLRSHSDHSQITFNVFSHTNSKKA